MAREKKPKKETEVQDTIASVEDVNGNKDETAVKKRKPRATKEEMAERKEVEVTEKATKDGVAKAKKASNKKTKSTKATKETQKVVPSAIEEIKAEEMKQEEIKPEEIKIEEIRSEEVKTEETNKEEVKAEETNSEEIIVEPIEDKKKPGRPKKSQKTKEVKQPVKKGSKKVVVKTNKNEAKKNKKEDNYKLIEAKVVFQQNGYELEPKAILESAKEAWLAKGHKESEIKSIELYIKPEEWAAYYVVNGESDENNKIDLPKF